MKYIYVRPGAYDYIKRVASHPRVILSFFTFMTEENMKDILGVISEGREPIDFPLFSKAYCSMMDDFPNLKPLQNNPWDDFRDINKVAGSDVCQ